MDVIAEQSGRRVLVGSLATWQPWRSLADAVDQARQ